MKWIEYKVNKIVKEDKIYPKMLNDLKRPPKYLFYRGELTKDIFKKTIAIVGSRRVTRYGVSVVDQFVSYFVSQGITTISGYMYGVDTQVHTKTVENCGKTVVVMGGGINQPYPPENDKLYTKILQSDGVVLSEYEPDMKPKLWTYPERNRIIAALSTFGVLVIEASERSGSLITVNYAKKLNKKIYAIPGQITSNVSKGTNQLIKGGVAELVTNPEDILGEKINKKVDDGLKLNLIGLEKEIYEALNDEEMSTDEISIAISKSLIEVSTALSMMSLKGIVSEAGGRFFITHV